MLYGIDNDFNAYISYIICVFRDPGECDRGRSDNNICRCNRLCVIYRMVNQKTYQEKIGSPAWDSLFRVNYILLYDTITKRY